MADIEIVADSGDLKAAIDLLNDYGMSFTQMVNKVQTEGNRLTRASKATTDQLTKAWDNAEKAITNKKNEEVARQEQATLKRREQNWKQFFQQDYMKSGGSGINASNSELLKQLEDQAKEEARILQQRQQNWKQFFQQDFMKPQGGGGAPTSASGSALLENEKLLADYAEETARATKEKAKEVAHLTRTLNPLLAAEQTYLKMQNDISRATELGILDVKQQAAALQQLEAEYRALGSGVYLAGSRFNQFGEMSGIAGKSAGRFGMYAQQAGYQIGDFAVQIQNGTNAGVAFSQQAAQLAGLIPGLTGAITTFAAIGVGLLIQNLSKGEKEAKTVFMELSKFKELEDVFASVGSSFETSMSQSISRIRAEYGAFVADIAQFQLQQEMDKLKANLGTVMDKATASNPDSQQGFLSRLGNMTSLTGRDGGLTEDYQRLQAEANKYNEVLAQVQEQQDKLFSGDINSREELVATFVDAYQTILQIPGVTQEIIDNWKMVAVESGISADQLERVSNSVMVVNEASKAAFDTYREMNTELQRSNELAAVASRYGQDSVQYLDAQKQQTLEILRADYERSGMADTLVDNLMRQHEAQIDFNQEAERSKLIIQQLINDLSAMSGIDISGVFTRAQGAANALLGTVRSIYAGMAAAAAEIKIRERAAVSKGNPLDPLGTFSGGQSAAFKTQIAAGGVVRSPVMPDWEDPEKAKKGGGKKGGKPKLSDEEKDAEKAKDKLEEFFKQYNLNIKQQERLLGVQGQNREELEKVIEIENRLGVARTMVSETQIQAMAREELALERKLERQEEIYNMGHDAVENLLMDIVTGTATIEEAFKGMLANIIKEVYQKYVAQGAADMAGNALVSLLSANGNAFGAGGVKMFADGGVVGSPTLFGYGGGKTGMMGEAGPEAIMPLKRNSQGKLGVAVSGGGSGDVHVTQVFQMSANGDASVKAIIQESMPKIQEAAKMAVVSAQRRSQKGFK